jgi:hypothetical protein
MTGEDDLPQLIETEWRDALPVGQWVTDIHGVTRDRDGVVVRGFRDFPKGAGKGAAAAIWYREEDDVVVLHHNDRMTGPLMARVYDAVTALRLQVARGRV